MVSKLTVVLSAILLLLSTEKVDTIQTYKSNMLELPPGTIIAQTFVAQHNNLSMIKIMDTFNPKYSLGREVKDDLVFHLKIYDKNDPFGGKDLATLVVNGSNVGNHSILQFKFDAVKDSANKKFIFYIENIGEQGLDSGVVASEYITVGFAGKSSYEEGELIYRLPDSRFGDVTGDLTFMSFYSVYPHEFVIGTVKDFTAKFLQDKIFLVFYISGIIGLSYWFKRLGKSNKRLLDAIK